MRCINLTSGSCKRRIGSTLAFRQGIRRKRSTVPFPRGPPRIAAGLERQRFANHAHGDGVSDACLGVLIGPRPRRLGAISPDATPRERIASAAGSEQGLRSDPPDPLLVSCARQNLNTRPLGSWLLRGFEVWDPVAPLPGRLHEHVYEESRNANFGRRRLYVSTMRILAFLLAANCSPTAKPPIAAAR